MNLPNGKLKAKSDRVRSPQYLLNTAVILSNFPKSALSIYKKLGIYCQFVSVFGIFGQATL